MRTLSEIVLVLVLVAVANGQSANPASLPADIYPDSLNRFPVMKREQMDENGKKAYDSVAGGPGKLVSPTGPVGIQLYSPGSVEPLRRLNEYLRREGSALGNALGELAILVAAREVDSQYEWSAHEPAGLRAGLSQAAIDVVKYNKALEGLGEKETLIIGLGRQLLRQHKLDAATFAKSVALFGRQGTLELITLIGDYTMNGLVLEALDQHLPADRKPLLPPR